MCTIGPKGEVRTHRPHAPSVPKEKLGNSNCMCHLVLIFRKLSTWVGFNYPPRLCPKDTDLNAPSAPNGKLGHTDHLCHWSQGKTRTHKLHVPSVPKARLGYLDCLWTVLELCTLSWGVSCKVVTRTLPKIQRNIMLCTITSSFWPELQQTLLLVYSKIYFSTQFTQPG